MTQTALTVSHLSKRYYIGERIRYGTIRDSLVNALTAPLRRLRGGSERVVRDSIWALKDISFEVKEGEVIGIIGRNGAGKSTLLKVLSRITEPTEGYADVYGRTGSLIEVGTGFHPELTGRENTFLNGAILGMTRQEINSKFDEIVTFAGVEKFIDTPVKHYSSGMYLRLAFAVAAHLEPDVLLVDEVLAVGDIAFQKKCLGKMEDIAGGGRTVLFVSHNMAAVKNLCQRAILLENGKIAHEGDVGGVVHAYNKLLAEPQQNPAQHKAITLANVAVDGASDGLIRAGQPFTALVDIHLRKPLEWFALYCMVTDGGGGQISVNRCDSPELGGEFSPGVYRIRVDFPALWLRPDVYTLQFKLMTNESNPREARMLSDSVMLNISGEVSPELLRGSLAPQTAWSLDQL